MPGKKSGCHYVFLYYSHHTDDLADNEFSFSSVLQLAYYIKRIIGLPGERVVIEGNEVSVYNGSEARGLNETYLPNYAKTSGDFEKVLGSEEYFVLGDNRNFSFDSRSWGPLRTDDIIGVVRFRLWPMSEVMAFGAPAYK